MKQKTIKLNKNVLMNVTKFLETFGSRLVELGVVTGEMETTTHGVKDVLLQKFEKLEV